MKSCNISNGETFLLRVTWFDVLENINRLCHGAREQGVLTSKGTKIYQFGIIVLGFQGPGRRKLTRNCINIKTEDSRCSPGLLGTAALTV